MREGDTCPRRIMGLWQAAAASGRIDAEFHHLPHRPFEELHDKHNDLGAELGNQFRRLYRECGAKRERKENGDARMQVYRR